jgi:pimeloyl-ACP methyl ester carboxylesterase
MASSPYDRLLGTAASALDRAVAAAMRARIRRGRPRSDGMPHDERMRRLARVREAYGDPALLADPDAFFTPPGRVVPALQRVRGLPDGGEVLDATWPSTATPYLEEVRTRYLAFEANQPAHARLYVSPSPRPAVVLVHGYLGGRWSVEEVAWPVAWMRRRGLDVALALLPFHALRGRPGGGPPPFPGADPRFINEGFRQAIADLRALIAILRARGAPEVGVMGMSLGGYTTALLATVTADLAFAVPMIPLASIADFARDQGRLGTGPEAALQHQALTEATRITSPLARPGLVPPERLLVIGAEADRITPIAHAEGLARHLGAPLHRLHGGHLLQLGRGDAFRAVRAMWQRLGIVAGP